MAAADIRIEDWRLARKEDAPFRDAIEHLVAELDLLMLLLYREVVRFRAIGIAVEDQFRGLYVSDEQVDAILSPKNDGNTAAAMNALIEERRENLTRRAQASAVAGVELPLERLVEIFSLNAFERVALVACAAVEVDLRFETLYSYAQNDVNRKRPTADLILRMFSESPAERMFLRAAFAAVATLMSNQLIRTASDPQRTDPSLLAKPLRADERIVEYLLGRRTVDERLRGLATVVEPEHSLSGLRLSAALLNALSSAARCFGKSGAVLVVSGPAGTGKRATAEALSVETHRQLVVADLRQVSSLPIPLAEVLVLLRREAILHGANLLLSFGDALADEHAALAQVRCDLERHLNAAGRLLFITTESPTLELRALTSPTLHFEFPMPGFQQRLEFWEEALGDGAIPAAASIDPGALSNKYVLSGGEIGAAARNAAHRALLHDVENPELRMEDLEAAARAQSNQGLRRLAQKVEIRHERQDLILPPRAMQQLRDVCAAERYRQVVYASWGFQRRLALGKGLNVMFCGPSGTGKTMAAGVLARELALDLYKIDLSTVVSKYIGETEKQLNRIFHQAQSSNAVLFFDEADALFGKRTEVKDAHDRYANVEVAYLLQKMEEYEGIVILATNYRKNMDDAFVRRMHHIVEFPLPDAEYRERIWTGLVPESAPLDTDVDFGFLARQFELAGGNIRNIVLAAAFLAAEEGGPMRMEHFILGTSRELQKMGKMPARSDFREYFEVIQTAG
jgi:SpoVK/Ycf46/Vps4 family AAA+-type ATPase